MNCMNKIMKQSGQIIMALILIMSVALAIGLSVIQKSLVDISTATKVEQSQRAFSAAEAGVEKALQGAGSTSLSLENFSAATVSDLPLLPFTATPGNFQDGLEYPPMAKEEVAHVWLADPASNLPTCDVGKTCYQQASLEIYWGDPLAGDKAAIEAKIIYYDAVSSSYKVKAYYLDPEIGRGNGFTTTANPQADVALSCPSGLVTTTQGAGRSFTCKATVSTLPSGLMLVRMRLLYNSSSQGVAVRAAVACGAGAGDCKPYSLSPQARIIVSTGTSGETQRTLKLFQLIKVVPPFFDFVIFSAGEVNK